MFGDEFEKRMKEIVEKAGIDKLKKCQETATIHAVRTAVENTPPNQASGGSKSGLATGHMANSWSNDSITKPDDKLTTWLINTAPYAQWVNNGHFVKKQFVPHLFIVNGHFVYDPEQEGGIMVGTKTQYVKGLYMKEKAIEIFKTILQQEINKWWERINDK